MEIESYKMLRCKLLQSLKIFCWHPRTEGERERERGTNDFYCVANWCGIFSIWHLLRFVAAVWDRRPSHRRFMEEIIAHSEHNARTASAAGGNHVAEMTRTKHQRMRKNREQDWTGKNAEKSKGFGQIAFISFSTHIIIYSVFSVAQLKPLMANSVALLLNFIT